jgi:hypothetical protein
MNKSLIQGAGILCTKAKFWDFLSLVVDRPVNDKDTATFVVREYCGIASRRELSTNKAAAELWKSLVNQFNTWANRP